MAEKIIVGRLVQKHDLEEHWLLATNFAPKQGELIVYDKDSEHEYERLKIGDGTTNVNDLPFVEDALKESLLEQINTIDGKVDAVSALVGDKSISEQINAAAANNQSDWDINDETNPAYIKNRPFYTESEFVTFVEEQTVTVNSELWAWLTVEHTPFVAGQTYTVVFNGTEYTCTATTDDNESFTLSHGGVHGDASDSFFCTSYSDGSTYLSVLAEGTYTISVTGYVHDIYKIDEKYIPGVLGQPGTGVGSVIFNDYEHNIASGRYAFALGSDVTASGEYSYAEGSNTVASGHRSHAEGSYTTSSGESSHAEGNGTVSSGQYSHAEGVSTRAAGRYQHVQGQFNVEDTASTYAHIVGNGKYNNRSNAHTLDWQGTAWFAGDVYVGSNSGINKDEGSKRLITEDDLASILPKMTTITLPASSWAGDANPWSQVVTMNGVTANSKIDLQPTALQIVDMQNNDIALMAENDDGIVTVYAIGSKPTVDYTMQALITEVAIV